MTRVNGIYLCACPHSYCKGMQREIHVIYQPIPDRLCVHCNRWKSVNEFYWRKDRRTFTSWCKACTNERSIKAQKVDPENTRAIVRRCHTKHKAQRNEYSRNYGKTHRAQIHAREKGYAERKRQYRQLHSEEYKRRRQEWERNHPDHVKAKKQRYRARKNELPDTLTGQEARYCRNYWDNRCAVCGRAVGLWNTIALDHWIPVTRDGGTVATNIIPLCQGLDGCNNSKGNRDPLEWLVWKYGKQQAKKVLKRVQAYFNHVNSPSRPPD